MSLHHWCAAFLAAIGFVTPAIAAELIVVEDSRCVACIRFEGAVGQSYDSSPQGRKAPLRRVNIANKVPADLAKIAIRGPIRGTPTFLLVDHGRAIGMFDGFSSSAAFYQHVDGLLQRVSASD